MAVKSDKPLPRSEPETREYWEGCKRHELLVQKCKNCGTFRFPPRPVCYNCASEITEWIRVSGKAQIYSWTVVRQNERFPVVPAFANDAPYALVIVELTDAEGIHMIGNLIDCPLDEISIGKEVEVVFDDVTEEVTLPRWRPISSTRR